MMFKPVNGAHLKSQDPKEVATSIFDFFLWQYKEAVKEEINARCDYNACIAANRAAEAEYAQNNELGWGPTRPYNDHYIKLKLEASEGAARNLTDMKAILDFIRNRFVDKFVETNI